MDERRDRRLDTWLETGRQFVDGVSGRRPGQRRSSLDLESVGRWVGDKVEWLLEDEEDWREPWQEDSPRAVRRGKRPLDAISRRQPPPSPAAPPAPRQESATVDDGEWPEDDSFRVDRWQRSSNQAPQPRDLPPVTRRPLPRSSRRRP